MYSAAVLVGGIVVGFVWNVKRIDLGITALKYFPDCTSINTGENPKGFPDLVRVTNNVAFVNRELRWY